MIYISFSLSIHILIILISNLILLNFHLERTFQVSGGLRLADPQPI
jgi:hypothetical protein